MPQRTHWENVYTAKSDPEVSWTQSEPRLSLTLIQEICPTGRAIDIGGGNSRLAALLLEAGYTVAVLDIAEAALNRGRAWVGQQADQVTWIRADITQHPSLGTFDVWHDRAVFHFLTNPADRQAYVSLLTETIPVGGHAVIATFALDGPMRCSGLDVVRYDGSSLARELGEGFELVKSVPELHQTPWGAPQSFQYSVFRRIASTS